VAQFHFAPASEDDARAILAWRYDGPYAVYNAPEGVPLDGYIAEGLDQRSPHFAMRLDTTPAGAPPDGFFALGSAGEVGAEPDAPPEPHLRRADGWITIGLGLRPDLTGQGLGLSFVEAGLNFARAAYNPPGFRLFVYAWNHRAQRVYERAGFAAVGRAGASDLEGQPAFIEMLRAE
jgi:RimJ/RimL family protein N-acetyltransferase